MQYRERLSDETVNWVRERVTARNEMFQDWATYLGMSKHMFSKILHQIKPLPAKYEDKWIEMEEYLKGDAPCATIKQKKN